MKDAEQTGKQKRLPGRGDVLLIALGPDPRGFAAAAERFAAAPGMIFLTVPAHPHQNPLRGGQTVFGGLTGSAAPDFTAAF